MAVSPTPPSISVLPPAPLPTDAEAVFDAKAGVRLTAEEVMVTEQNAALAWQAGSMADTKGYKDAAAISAGAAADSATAAAGSVTAAAGSVTAAQTAAQTAQIAAAASGASAGIGQLGNPGDSLQVNAARTGLVFGPSDGKVGDVLISARNPGPLFVPANGGIRAQSALPSLLGVLGLLGGQVGQQYATLSAGTTTTVVDVASAPNPNGGPPLVMQVTTAGSVNFSSDGGATWVARTALPAAPLSVSYDEFNNLWLVTFSTPSGNQIAYSADNAATAWVLTPATVTLPSTGASKIAADINGVWIATGLAATTSIFRSTNKGLTWTAIYSGASAIHTAISTDNKGVWCVTAGATVRRSVDGGLTWAVQFTASSTQNAISNDRNGVWLISGLTSNSNTYKSVDNGLTWTLLATPVTSTVTDIAYSQGFFFLVRNVSPQLIMISSAADATVYTVPTAAVLASLIKVTATAGYVVAVNSANTTVLRSAPIFAYDTSSQFQLPNFPVATGLQAWVKAGLVWLSSGKAFTSVSTVGTAITGIDTDGAGVIIVIDGSTIRRSSDFGVTWATITNPPGLALASIVTNRKGLWLAGANTAGTLIRSTDNGLTFSIVSAANHGFTVGITQLVIGKDDVMIGCMNSGIPRRSTDGGLTWSAVSAGGNNGIAKAATDGQGKWVFAQTTSKLIYTSSDNGATFVSGSAFTLSGSISDIVMTLDGKVLISGTTSGIFKAALFTDYGLTLAGDFTVPSASMLLKRGPGKGVLAFNLANGVIFTSDILQFGVNNWVVGSTSPTSTSSRAATSGDKTPFILVGTTGGASTLYNGTIDTLI